MKILHQAKAVDDYRRKGEIITGIILAIESRLQMIITIQGMLVDL